MKGFSTNHGSGRFIIWVAFRMGDLLDKIDVLQTELSVIKNRLGLLRNNVPGRIIISRLIQLSMS